MASKGWRLYTRKALLAAFGGSFSAGLPAFGRLALITDNGKENFSEAVWDVMFVGLLLAWVAAIAISCSLDDDDPYSSFFVGLGLPAFVLGTGGAFVGSVQ